MLGLLQFVRIHLAIFVVVGLAGLITARPAEARQRGQIVFQSTVDDNTDIYVMDEDGTNVRRLTDAPEGDRSPKWSPGGKRIAFVSDRDDTRQVYTMDPDGGGVRRLTDAPIAVSVPAWSPDGQKMAFFAQYQEYGIHIMGRDGQNVRFLTGTPDRAGDPGTHFQPHLGIDWSPDGRTLIFNTHGNESEGVIWAVDADGRNLRDLSKDGQDLCQAWSPDGQLILFIFHGLDPGFYTMRPDGRNRREVLVPASGGCPRWSADGREIIFSMDGDIHIVSATGKGLRRLVELPGDEWRYDWFDPAYARAVSAGVRSRVTWGRLKRQVPRPAEQPTPRGQDRP